MSEDIQMKRRASQRKEEKMRRRIFFNIIGIGLIFSVILIAGCTSYNGTRFYVPKMIPIKKDTLLKDNHQFICAVNIVNEQKKSRWVDIGDYTHEWRANLRMWTDTAVEVLTHELEKHDVRITEESEHILKLSITWVKLYWGFNTVGCQMNLRVETGDDYTVNLETANEAQDIYQASDGAVMKAVTEMFHDHEIQDYLTRKKTRDDDDCDGVKNNRDRCAGTPLGVEVDEWGCPKDSDGDGIIDIHDQCPGTPPGVIVDDRGCPVDEDGDGVVNSQDRCPGTPVGARVDDRGCWIVGSVLFDLGKDDIRSDYYYLLDEVARVLKRNPGMSIEVQGHTCTIGSAKYNQELSERRANAVRNYLTKKGINSGRLTARGYGYTRPVAASTTDAGKRLNRRVEFHPVTE